MKGLLLVSALFTSGGAVAVQNETAQEAITRNIDRIKEVMQHKQGGYDLEAIRENGFPYPTEDRLEQLTEEQAFELISFIDQVNANYDFSSMTDEELEVALDEIKDELHALHEELGIEGSMMQERNQHRGEFGRETGRRARERRGNPFGDELDGQPEDEETPVVPDEETDVIEEETDVIDEENAEIA